MRSRDGELIPVVQRSYDLCVAIYEHVNRNEGVRISPEMAVRLYAAVRVGIFATSRASRFAASQRS